MHPRIMPTNETTYERTEKGRHQGFCSFLPIQMSLKCVEKGVLNTPRLKWMCSPTPIFGVTGIKHLALYILPEKKTLTVGIYRETHKTKQGQQLAVGPEARTSRNKKQQQQQTTRTPDFLGATQPRICFCSYPWIRGEPTPLKDGTG